MWPLPKLETDRLYLRTFTRKDIYRVYRLINHPAISQMLPLLTFPYSYYQTSVWINAQHKNWLTQGTATYAIVDKASHLLMGAISLTGSQSGSAELGFWLGVDYWHQGYCTEAAGAICDFGFNVLNLSAIFARHLIDNPVSGRVIRKLGFELIGTSQYVVADDQPALTLPLYTLSRQRYTVILSA